MDVDYAYNGILHPFLTIRVTHLPSYHTLPPSPPSTPFPPSPLPSLPSLPHSTPHSSLTLPPSPLTPPRSPQRRCGQLYHTPRSPPPGGRAPREPSGPGCWSGGWHSSSRTIRSSSPSGGSGWRSDRGGRPAQRIVLPCSQSELAWDGDRCGGS